MTETSSLILGVNETRLMGSMFCVYLAFSVLKNVSYMSTSYRIHYGLWSVGFVVRKRLPAPRIPAAYLPGLLVLFSVFLLAYAFTAARLWGLAALAIYLVTFPSILDLHLIHQKSSNCPLVLAILLLSTEYHAPLFYASSLAASHANPLPLMCIRALLASIYLATGFEKLRAAGWKWTRGGALQWYLFEHHLWGGFRLAVPLMRSLPTLRVLSTVTVVTQLSAPLIVLGGWLPAIHGIFAIGFHLSTQLFMGIYFLTFFGPAAVSSALSYPLAMLAETQINPSAVTAMLGPLGPAPSPSSAWQVALMALIPAIQVYSQFSWKLGFPFGSYKLFSFDHSEFTRFAVLLLELGDRSGTYRPWQPFDYYDTRNLSHLGYDCNRRTTGLSPQFDETLRQFYWPVIQREDPALAANLQSIRLVLRHAIWNGPIPAGYDDYAIAFVQIEDGRLSNHQAISPIRLRSYRFGEARAEEDMVTMGVMNTAPIPARHDAAGTES